MAGRGKGMRRCWVGGGSGRCGFSISSGVWVVSGEKGDVGVEMDKKLKGAILFESPTLSIRR